MMIRLGMFTCTVYIESLHFRWQHLAVLFCWTIFACDIIWLWTKCWCCCSRISTVHWKLSQNDFKWYIYFFPFFTFKHIRKNLQKILEVEWLFPLKIDHLSENDTRIELWVKLKIRSDPIRIMSFRTNSLVLGSHVFTLHLAFYFL